MSLLECDTCFVYMKWEMSLNIQETRKRLYNFQTGFKMSALSNVWYCSEYWPNVNKLYVIVKPEILNAMHY